LARIAVNFLAFSTSSVLVVALITFALSFLPVVKVIYWTIFRVNLASLFGIAPHLVHVAANFFAATVVFVQVPALVTFASASATSPELSFVRGFRLDTT